MRILHLRMYDMKYYFDFIFRCTPKAKEAKRALGIINSFAEQVILQRRTELMHMSKQQVLAADEHSVALKRKRTLLDILLNSTIDGKSLSNMDIREEVHTFMFAGHDTLSSALMFFFYCILSNREWERKCYEEIRSVFGTKIGAVAISREHLNQLHYVDLCIKETLRMYPPVALIGRKVLQETKISKNIFVTENFVFYFIFFFLFFCFFNTRWSSHTCRHKYWLLSIGVWTSTWSLRRAEHIQTGTFRDGGVWKQLKAKSLYFHIFFGGST